MDVGVQAQADLVITSIVDITGNGTYIEGETFTVRVNYENTGGTDALAVDSLLEFSGSYAYLSPNNPPAITVSANDTSYQDFQVTVTAGATNALVTIDCTVSGTEEHSLRSLVASSGSNDLLARMTLVAALPMLGRA